MFVALTGFSQVLPNVFSVSLHIKILPFVSFVWGGSFFMVAAMLPMVGLEFSGFRRALRMKRADLYGEEEEDEAPPSSEISEAPNE